MRSTFNATAILLFGRMIGFGINFLTPLIIVRLFNQTEFGTYKQAFLIYTTLFGIAQAGMAESLYYFLPSSPEKAGRYVANSFSALLFSGLCAFLGLQLWSAQIDRWLGNPALSADFPLLGGYLLLMLVSAPLEILMIARGKCGVAAFTYAASDFLRNGLLLWAALELGGSLHAVLIGSIAFAVLRVTGAILYTVPEFRSGFGVDVDVLIRHVRYAAPMALYVLVDMGSATLSQYVVAHHFDTAIFAIFAVGCMQVPLVDYVITSASSVMMVQMAEHIRAGCRARVIAIWHEITRQLALIFFPLACLLIVIAPQLITVLFTRTYSAAAPLFMIWSCTIILAAFQTDGVLRVYADTPVLFLFSSIRFLVLLGLSMVLIGECGLTGAVVFNVIAQTVYRVLSLGRAKRRFGVGLGQLLPWRSVAVILACSIASMAPVALCERFLDLPPVAGLVLGGLIYGLVYCAALQQFRQLNVYGLLARVVSRGSGVLRPKAAVAVQE